MTTQELQATSSSTAKEIFGMASRSLGKEGFAYVHQTKCYCRHSLGIGGVYIRRVATGYHIRVPELKIDYVAETLSLLKCEIADLNEMEYQRAVEFRNRVREFDNPKTNPINRREEQNEGIHLRVGNNSSSTNKSLSGGEND